MSRTKSVSGILTQDHATWWGYKCGGCRKTSRHRWMTKGGARRALERHLSDKHGD